MNCRYLDRTTSTNSRRNRFNRRKLHRRLRSNNDRGHIGFLRYKLLWRFICRFPHGRWHRVAEILGTKSSLETSDSQSFYQSPCGNYWLNYWDQEEVEQEQNG